MLDVRSPYGNPPMLQEVRWLRLRARSPSPPFSVSMFAATKECGDGKRRPIHVIKLSTTNEPSGTSQKRLTYSDPRREK